MSISINSNVALILNKKNWLMLFVFSLGQSEALLKCKSTAKHHHQKVNESSDYKSNKNPHFPIFPSHLVSYYSRSIF